MARRKKIYYVESEIIKNLDTSGKEWMYLETREEYIGKYHKYETTNEVFTESEWHPTKSKSLIPYEQKPKSYFQYEDIVSYVTINGEKKEKFGTYKPNSYSTPIPILRQPYPKEKKAGVMTRYLLIKRNEKDSRLPIEVDKRQASTYNVHNSGINQFLYELVEVPWKIDGPEFDVIENGILRTPGVFSTNKRIVERYSRKFPILSKFLTNYREFSMYNRNT